MTGYIRLLKVGTILLFVITFAVVGWAAPILYASHAPESNFIEVNEFEASDSSPDADSHEICIDRTIHSETTGQTVTELYLVNGDKPQELLDSHVTDRYFQEGNQETVSDMPLPPDIQPGEYKYLLVVRMNLVNDRLTRDFTFTSNAFTIEEGANGTVKSC